MSDSKRPPPISEEERRKREPLSPWPGVIPYRPASPPPAATATTCTQCGGDAGARCHAVIRMEAVPVNVDASYAMTDEQKRVLDLRFRIYDAHKWLSRLLGIGLNQVVAEAERRVHHPLGKDEPWTGTKHEWDLLNVTILEGSIARLKEQAATGECRCAECRGETVDLDAPSAATASAPPARRAEEYPGELAALRAEVARLTAERDAGRRVIASAADAVVIAEAARDAARREAEQDRNKLADSRDEARAALAALREAVRAALGTMQKPMERMLKVCAWGLTEPACDHVNLRALGAAMKLLDDAHAEALASVERGAKP